MPEGVLERIVAAVVLLAITALAVALVPAWQDYRERLRQADGRTPSTTATRAGAAGTTAAATQPAPPTTTAASTTAALAPEPRRAEAPSRPARPRLARFAIAARRGDCWVAVRVGSSTGRLLYTGFLDQGSLRKFRARSLWVRLGASRNVDLRLNGRRVDGIPFGTVVLLVRRQGVRVLGTA